MDERKKHDECMKLYYGSSIGEDIHHVAFENIYDAGVEYGMQSAKEEIERLKNEIERYKGVLHDSEIFSREKYELIDKLEKRLESGRDYLMQSGSDCNDSDALQAFGFGRNGLGEDS